MRSHPPGGPRRPPRAARALLALGLAAILASLAPSLAAAAPPPQPTAATEGASGVTYSSAILHGSVNAHGQATNYLFQYGATRAYGAQTPLSPAGNGTITIRVGQAVGGLQPLTRYHYRIVAIGPSGTALGGDRTFTTTKVPLSLAIVGVPNPVLFGSPFVVEGTLSGTGAANHQVVLQANAFPYLGGFQTVGNPQLTNAAGGFSFPFLGLLENAQLRVVTVGKPEVSSPVVLESVAVRVSFHAHSTGRRGYVRLYGTVAPAEVGALVGFQLLQPGHRSVNQGGTIVKAGTAAVSRFSRVVRVRRGLYRALVRVADGAHVSGYSNPVLVR
ncbi:MAG TPA: hypothetical protein VES97_02070 [Solirubrobacteraceae bacterium]|nr:hypothetical protein [Solirubrobacteraceae bacterium]HYM66638.1 hypothetical protein [Patescibacteria group bacterium]